MCVMCFDVLACECNLNNGVEIYAYALTKFGKSLYAYNMLDEMLKWSVLCIFVNLTIDVLDIWIELCVMMNFHGNWYGKHRL